MMTTAKQETERSPRKAVPVYAGKTEEESRRNYAAVATSPELAAYRVINGAEQKSGFGEHIDVPTLLEQLCDQATTVNLGDLAQAETMLMNQATALQSLFARLAERGMGCDHAATFEANMRMALRAQSQCRATLQTLVEIKNPPPVAFVRQANIGQAVQVNNAATPDGGPSRAGAGETEKPHNELLEDKPHERLDTGTPSAAVGADPAMAADDRRLWCPHAAREDRDAGAGGSHRAQQIR